MQGVFKERKETAKVKSRVKKSQKNEVKILANERQVTISRNAV